MALNPNIILGVAPFDPTGAMDRGATAANRQNAFARERAYNAALDQNGAAAMRGDVNAQNALARFDPNMVQGLESNALGMQAQQLGMQATRQNMDIQREELAMRREQARQEAAAALAAQQSTLDAAKMAAEATRARDLLVRAGRFHAEGNEAGYNLFLQQNGLDPADYPMAEYRYIAATMEGVLDAVDAAAGPQAEPMSPEGKLQADIAAGFVPEGTTRTPETVVNNYEGGTGRQVFDRMVTMADSANAAASGLRSIAEARAAVQSGIVSGFGADQVLGLQKLGAALGVVDPQTIQNTETFRSAIAPQIAAMIRATVGSANISNADREFAEKAAGGAITLDAGSIERLLGIMEKMNRATIESYQARLDAVYPPENPAFAQDRALLSVRMPDLPPLAAPQPQTPAAQTAPPNDAAPAPAVDSGSQPSGLSPEAQSVFEKYRVP